jgi:hypothetical protein
MTSLWIFAPVPRRVIFVGHGVREAVLSEGETDLYVRKPTGHQDRVFSSDRDRHFAACNGARRQRHERRCRSDCGCIAVLQQGTRYRPTNCRSRAEYSDLPLPNGKDLRLAVAEMVSPKVDHCFAKALNQICPSKCHCQRSDRFFSRTAKREWDRSFTRRGVRT